MSANDMMRFRFKTDFDCPIGKLRAGDEITIVKGFFYFNGGMIEPQYYPLFEKLLRDKKMFDKYLKQVPIPYNKA